MKEGGKGGRERGGKAAKRLWQQNERRGISVSLGAVYTSASLEIFEILQLFGLSWAKVDEKTQSGHIMRLYRATRQDVAQKMEGK